MFEGKTHLFFFMEKMLVMQFDSMAKVLIIQFHSIKKLLILLFSYTFFYIV